MGSALDVTETCRKDASQHPTAPCAHTEETLSNFTAHTCKYSSSEIPTHSRVQCHFTQIIDSSTPTKFKVVSIRFKIKMGCFQVVLKGCDFLFMGCLNIYSIQ